MSSLNQTLGEWARDLNDTIYNQPNIEVARKAFYELMDPSLVMKINHAVCEYSQLVSLFEQARETTSMSTQTWDVLHEWQDPEKKDGTVAISTRWTMKDNATGVETKKFNLAIWEVKIIDGKRKLTAMTEVE